MAAHNLLRDGDDGAVCRTLHVLREHRPDPSLQETLPRHFLDFTWTPPSIGRIPACSSRGNLGSSRAHVGHLASHSRRRKAATSRLHLGPISGPISATPRPHLDHISARSRLDLASISATESARFPVVSQDSKRARVSMPPGAPGTLGWSRVCLGWSRVCLEWCREVSGGVGWCRHAAWLHRAAHRLVVLGRQEPAGVRPDHQRLSHSLSNTTLQQGEYISVGRGGCVDDGLGRPSRHQHKRTLGESVSSSRELVWTLRLHRTLPRTMWWECDAQRCVPTAAAVCPFSTVRE